MSAEKALLGAREIIEKLGDLKAVHSFYIEFRRRLEVLRLVEAYCNLGSTVLDIGAQPFIISCTLRKMGYDVIAFDVYPEPYKKIAEACDVSVVRCDLERDELGVSNADCAVFTEVLEHLHYLLRTLSLEQDKQGPEAGGPSTHNTECGVAIQKAETAAWYSTRVPVSCKGVYDERGTSIA